MKLDCISILFNILTTHLLAPENIFGKKLAKIFLKSPEIAFFQEDVHVKTLLMMKTKTIAKGKYFGSPALLYYFDLFLIYYVFSELI